MEIDFETIAKKQLKQVVSDEIDELINDEVNKFYTKLSQRKEHYIAELMKSIRIYSEQQTLDNMPRYLITIENTYKIER